MKSVKLFKGGRTAKWKFVQTRDQLMIGLSDNQRLWYLVLNKFVLLGKFEMPDSRAIA